MLAERSIEEVFSWGEEYFAIPTKPRTVTECSKSPVGDMVSILSERIKAGKILAQGDDPYRFLQPVITSIAVTCELATPPDNHQYDAARISIEQAISLLDRIVRVGPGHSKEMIDYLHSGFPGLDPRIVDSIAERIGDEVGFEVQVSVPDQVRVSHTVQYVNDPMAIELGLVDPANDAGQ